jgi:hypothetical protein
MHLNLDMRSARQLAPLCVTLLFAALPGMACAADPPAQPSATPSSLSSVFSAAQAGDTILLAAGDYGRFEGAMKAGNVTLKAQPGAKVSMQLRFSPAQNITIDGLTLTDIVIGDSRTKNITVRNSDIPGGTVLRTSELDNANILFDHNVHRDWNKCDGCYEGRLELPGSDNQAQSGVTIQDSEFKGGVSDGIQNGARGVKILNNTFHDLVAGTPDGVHTDAIQLYGSRETIIRGNYFHDVGSKIMAPDGADHELIEDNVFAGDGYPYAIVLFSDVGSIVRHNTLATGSCWFNMRCGVIRVGSKTGGCRYANSCDAGTGTVVEDNILSVLSNTEGSATFTSRFNLFMSDNRGGQGDRKGTPRYVSANPTTWADYALAPGSPGKGDASDGSDRGIRVDGLTRPATTASSKHRKSSIRVLSTLRSIRRSGRLRLRLQIGQAGEVMLSGVVHPRAGRPARLKTLPLGQVQAGTRTVSLKLSPSARRRIGRARAASLSASLRVGSTVTRAKLTIKRR